MKTLSVSLFMLALAATCQAAGTWVGIDAQDRTPHENAPAPPAAALWTAREVIAQNNARGMDFNVYIRLKPGMGEGEVLLRAGKPDSESVENIKNDVIKTYYYFPTPADPYITTVKLQGGTITSITRTKQN